MKRLCVINSTEDCICLQSGIELVRGWCAANLTEINMSKTRVITFNKIANVLYFVFSETAPQWARTSSFTRFLDRTQGAPQSVGLLWMSDQLVAVTST